MYHKITKQLRKVLDEDRFEHTLGVAHTAACLAMKYGENMNQAYLAGLLHDCAKCIDNDDKKRMCSEYGIELTEIELQQPFLIHAKLGAYLAGKKYDVDDEEIQRAIRYHTTGRPNMSLLEEIIFVSDYIEPNRKKQPRLEQLRWECFTDLRLGILHILEDILVYLHEKDAPIDDMTQQTYDYYKKLMESGN